MACLDHLDDLLKDLPQSIAWESVLEPGKELQNALLLFDQLRDLELKHFASLRDIFDFLALAFNGLFKVLLLTQKCLDLQLQFLFLDFDCLHLCLQELVLLVDALFSLVAVPLQCVSLHDFSLELLELIC